MLPKLTVARHTGPGSTTWFAWRRLYCKARVCIDTHIKEKGHGHCACFDSGKAVVSVPSDVRNLVRWRAPVRWCTKRVSPSHLLPAVRSGQCALDSGLDMDHACRTRGAVVLSQGYNRYKLVRGSPHGWYTDINPRWTPAGMGCVGSPPQAVGCVVDCKYGLPRSLDDCCSTPPEPLAGPRSEYNDRLLQDESIIYAIYIRAVALVRSEMLSAFTSCLTLPTGGVPWS